MEEGASGTKQFLYNTKNQQTEVRLEDGRVQVNRYDAENLRCEMMENEKLIQFVYHCGELLYERSEENQTSYYIGGGIEASQNCGKIHYYHQDEQLSTKLITRETSKIITSMTHSDKNWEMLKEYLTGYGMPGSSMMCRRSSII